MWCGARKGRRRSSGVSGGSLGSTVFAGLAADYARNTPDPGCNIGGLKSAGPIVNRARKVLSSDLLSPLLGALLFPDALQRVLPVPIDDFDRARALEYAVELNRLIQLEMEGSVG